MSQVINNTLIELLIKMFATLVVVIGLLAMSTNAEARSFESNEQHTQTARLEGQLRSSIAFERAFDRESVNLTIKGTTIYLVGELSGAEQRNNLIRFIESFAPHLLVKDSTRIAEAKLSTKTPRASKLMLWVKNSTDKISWLLHK